MEDALINNMLEILSGEASNLDPSNDELLFLSSELGYLHRFLKTTDCLNKGHRLVMQIRDVAFHAEDIIDNYDAYYSTEKGNILERYFRPGSTKAKNDLVRNIKDFKKRSSTIRKGIEKLKTEENHGVEAVSSGHQKASIPEEADVVGFTKEVDILVDQLTSEKSKPALTAISIVGMAGLGKSTLANKIYNHDLVKEKFTHRAWICVSDKKITRAGLLLSILMCLDKLTEERKAMHEDDLVKELENCLKGETYLVVLDDVWRREVWDNLKAFLPDSNNGSRILLTSRFKKLALIANPDPKDPPHYLGFLEKAESWELFKSKAFQGSTCTKKWEELGQQIAGKCGGLPLAIKVLGHYLREARRADKETRKKEANEREVYYLWSEIRSRASSYLYENSSECKGLLALSYNYLPSYMKPCFLYFSVFPEDFLIPARQLIQLWVAEGFITKYADSDETMEETASRYLEMFADQGLIQVVQRTLKDDKVKTCRIHSLYRDFCISEARKENFVLYVNDKPVEFLRRLVGDAGKIEHNVEKLGQLRSLLCFSHMSSTSEEWSCLFKATKLLKVFSVSHVSILPDTVGNLPLLTYLGLDKNSLQQIPASVCNLPNLQVLDARSKFPPTAPDGIWSLKKIRHVYFTGPTFLPPAPSPVSSPTRSPLRRTLSSLPLKFKSMKAQPRSKSLVLSTTQMTHVLSESLIQSPQCLLTQSPFPPSSPSANSESQLQLQPQPLVPLLQFHSWTAPPPKSLETQSLPLARAYPMTQLSVSPRQPKSQPKPTQSQKVKQPPAPPPPPQSLPPTLSSSQSQPQPESQQGKQTLIAPPRPPPVPLLYSQSQAQPGEQLPPPPPPPPPRSQPLLLSFSQSQPQQLKQQQPSPPPPPPPPSQSLLLPLSYLQSQSQSQSPPVPPLSPAPSQTLQSSPTPLLSSHLQSHLQSRPEPVKQPLRIPPLPPPPPTLRLPQTPSLSSDSQTQPQPAKQPQPLQLLPPPVSSLQSWPQPALAPPPPPTPPSRLLPSSSSHSKPVPAIASPAPHDGIRNHEDVPYSLKHLQTLSTISAESCTMEVLRRLPNLLKLGIMVKGYLNSLSDNLVLLKKLHTLKLVGATDFPPLITLPLKFPPNLIKLTLTETKLDEDPMPLLGELEKLEVLKLSKNAYSGTEMVFSRNSFQQLKRLKLVSLEYITELAREKGALPKLEQLFLYDCHHLKVFNGFQHLNKLQDVYLKNPTTELRESMQQENLQFQLHICPLQ